MIDLNNIKELIETDLEKANKLLELYKEENSNIIEYYSLKGIIKVKENNLESALDYFIKALEIDNTNVDVLYNIAYINLISGNTEYAIEFYKKCLEFANNKELKKELIEILNSLGVYIQPKKTIVVVGMQSNSKLLNLINKDYFDIIILDEDEKYEKENKYIENNIITYEINAEKTKYMIEYILRRHEEVILIVNDTKVVDKCISFRERCRLIYYIDRCIYTEDDYLNKNINLFIEKQGIDECDFAITSDIDAYNYKTFVELRSNIYFINNDMYEFKFENMDRFIQKDSNTDFKEYFIKYSEKIEDDYEKSKYILASQKENMSNWFNIVNYMYTNYKNKMTYDFYCGLLCRGKNFDLLIQEVINNDFCLEIYKAELIYIYTVKDFEMIEFIFDISIKNYKCADFTNDNYLKYRMALLNYEATKYDASFKLYNEILEKENNYLMNSPMFNRNISYLKYMNKELEYKKYFINYKEFMKSLDYEA